MKKYYDIPKDKLEIDLKKCGYNQTAVARKYGCDQKTISRRCQQYNLNIPACFIGRGKTVFEEGKDFGIASSNEVATLEELLTKPCLIFIY